ncbi:MAG: hypothetical protein QXR97_05575 [Thermoproteota archaeon]
MEKSLPEMVKEYLEAKYREDPYPFHLPIVYPIHYHILSEEMLVVKKSLDGKKLKWSVSTSPFDIFCMSVKEDEDGKVWVLSGCVDYIRDILYDYVKEKAYDIMVELRDRWNWRKYRRKFGKVIAYLAWNDEVARRITEKTGIKVVHQIGLPEYYDSKIEGIFYAVKDLKDVSDPIKFLFITKMIDAIDEAFKLGLFVDKFAREEYESFERKYISEGKRKK